MSTPASTFSRPVAADFALRAEVPAAQAAAFLRSLPPLIHSGARAARWVVPAGGTLRPASRPTSGAVSLPGAERLLSLRPVLRHATAVRVYSPDVAAGQAAPVAWEVELPGMRQTLLLSQDAARGFSGEGGVLCDLATASAEHDAEAVSELPAWEAEIDTAELSRQAGMVPDRVRAALTVLGTSVRSGYGLAEEACCFHRRLRYSASAAGKRNPRLQGARALVAEGAVRLEGEPAWAGAGEHAHLVRADDTGAVSCTCLWWAEYRGDAVRASACSPRPWSETRQRRRCDEPGGTRRSRRPRWGAPGTGGTDPGAARRPRRGPGGPP